MGKPNTTNQSLSKPRAKSARVILPAWWLLALLLTAWAVSLTTPEVAEASDPNNSSASGPSEVADLDGRPMGLLIGSLLNMKTLAEQLASVPVNSLQQNQTLSAHSASVGLMAGTLVKMANLVQAPGPKVPSPPSGSTINIGSSTVGTPVSNGTLNITNSSGVNLDITAVAISGANAGDFSITNPAIPVTIPPGGSQTITIQCIPGAAGARTGRVDFTTSDGTNPFYNLQCTGLTPSFASNPPPGAVNFGIVPIGGNSTQNITVMDQSPPANGTLVVNGYNLTGSGDFSVVAPPSTPISVNPGGSVNIVVQCAPTGVTGIRNATLKLTTNDPATPIATYNLSCDGEMVPKFQGGPPPPGPINIVSSVGTFASLPLAVDNVGSTASVLNVTVNPPGGVFTASPPSLTATQGFPTSIITVGCTPAASGTVAGTLTLNTNDPVQPVVTYNLTCTGNQAIYNSNPIAPSGTINVGSTSVGAIINFSLDIFNTGNTNLLVNVASISGPNAADFSAGPSSFTIAPGGAPNGQTMTVSCNPTAGPTGLRTATLNLTTNDNTQGGGTGNVTYTLNCTVLAPIYNSVPAIGSTINVGTSSLGVPVTAVGALSISNTGNGTLLVNSGGFTGPNAADFSINPTSLTLGAAPSPAQTIDITCTPSTAGALSAVLTLSTNDLTQGGGSGSVTYNLTCTGQAPNYGSTPVASGGVILVGTTSVGIMSSPAYQLTITNVGAAGNLVVNSGSLGGANASEFAISGVTFPFTVAPNATQVINLTCTPNVATPGPTRTATLNLTSNDPATPAPAYTLNCNVLAPIYGSSPNAPTTTINLGSSNVGTPTPPVAFNLTITNNAAPGGGTLTVNQASFLGAITGPNASDFTLGGAALPLNLAPGASAVLTLQCTPSAGGARTASLDLKSNDPAQQTPSYPLQCTGLAPAFASTPPVGAINVGSSAVGTPSAPFTLNIQNTGTATLTVNFGSFSNPAEFSISGAFPLSIAPGSSANVTLQCTPSAAGARSSSMTFGTNDPVLSTPTYSLTCTGLVPGYNSTPVAPSGTINVGSSPVGTASTAFVLTLQNTGGTNLTVSLPGGGAITGANASEFSLTGAFPFSIPPNGSVTVSLQCTPAGVGARTATMTLNTSDSNQPTPTYTLNCTGTLPGYNSTPAGPNSAINVGSTTVGVPVNYSLTLQNTGGANLTISLPGGGAMTGANPGDFSVTGPFPITLAGGASQVVTVQCNPTASGIRTATMTFNTTDLNQPAPFYSLSCAGLTPGFGYTSGPVPAGGTINLGNVAMGLTGNGTLTVFNTGSSTLTVSLPGGGALTGPNASDFFIDTTAFPFTINVGGASVQLRIQCRPSVLGTRTATLTFSTTDLSQPTVTYTLVCTGVPPNTLFPADLVLQLSVSPDRLVANDLDNLLVYTFKVKNIGAGSASFVTLRLPIDGYLQIGYAKFEDPRIWVTSVTANEVVIALPNLAYGDSATGLITFRPKLVPRPPAGTKITTRFAVHYDDPVGVDNTRKSNAVIFAFDEAGHNESAAMVQLMTPTSLSGKVGKGMSFTALFLAPDEQVNAWLTKPDGSSIEIKGGWANKKGEFILDVPTFGLLPGKYTATVLGAHSQVKGNAELILTEPNLTPSSTSVRTGTTLNFTVDFLGASETVNAWITGPDGKSKNLKGGRSDAFGNFTFSFDTVGMSAGNYVVVVYGNVSKVKGTAVLGLLDLGPVYVPVAPILAAVSHLDPNNISVTAGTKQTFNASFLTPNEVVNAWLTRPDGKSMTLNGGKADAKGGFSLTVDTTGLAAGSYKVVVNGGSSKLSGDATLLVKDIPASPVAPPVVGSPAPTVPNPTPTQPPVAAKPIVPAFAKLNPANATTTSGSKLVFTAGALVADEPVSSWWTGADGKSTPLGVSKASSNGGFVLTVDTTGLPAGSYNIVVYGNTSKLTSSAVLVISDPKPVAASPGPVKPAVAKLTPGTTSTKAGGKLTFTGNFLKGKEAVSTWITGPDGKSKPLTGGHANADGTFSLTVSTSGLAPGSYVVVISGNDSKAIGSAVITVTP